MPLYHINLFWSGADGRWVTDVTDLKSWSAFGDTPEGARRETQEALQAQLEATRTSGRAIPEPRSRRAIYA